MIAKLTPVPALLVVVILLGMAAACAAETGAPLPAGMATGTPPVSLSTSAPTPVADYSERVDGYLASAPAVLRPGRTEHISVSLFDGAEPARGPVRVALLQGVRRVAEGEGTVSGAASIPLAVPPELVDGDYILQIAGGAGEGAFTESGRIRVAAAPALLFLETDKPIYRPGQEIRIRSLRLNDELKPAPGPVTIEVQDGKGIKVYRQILDADEFGIANGSLPLATEANLGVWKITGASGEQETQLDVRVEKYVLPKYEVRVDLPQEWTLVDAPIAGSVSAEYSFGKPVQGEVVITAARYVGVWEEYARFEGAMTDGLASFELPAVEYAAGVPGAAGLGRLQLDIAVREPATGYEERVTRLLTVAEAPVHLQVIPESRVFKPGLPLSALVVAETPDNRPVSVAVDVELAYVDEQFETIAEESRRVATGAGGGALVELTPPAEAIGLTITASVPGAWASLALEAGYSPSGSFIHIAPAAGEAALAVGERAAFRVHSTAGAEGRFYYEVVGRGGILFSGIAWTPDIAFATTPAMAPESDLVVYQVMPDGEVAADYIPFRVAPGYPMAVEVAFSSGEVRPGAAVDISVQTDGPARVGLAAVDRSVFILAENRLNLQQVFDELERQYRQPRAEIHYHEYLPQQVAAPGAAEIFREAGLMTLSDRDVPAGVAFHEPVPVGPSYGPDATLVVILVIIGLIGLAFVVGILALIVAGAVKLLRSLATGLALAAAVAAVGGLAACGGGAGYVAAPEDFRVVEQATGAPAPAAELPDDLAQVERVRQFFPETWLWADVMTDESGRATLPLEAPDSITTWQARAVGVSPEHGLGIGEAALTVFQPFFLEIDRPYSAIRGEEFPVRVALYNYLNTAQEFWVELEESAHFELLGESRQRVTVAANEVGGVEFDIRLTGLGQVPLRVTARSAEAGDAVVDQLLVEAEGVAEERVSNAILAPGDRMEFETAPPADAVAGSDRAYIALTGSYLAQSIRGLDDLLAMPYGCGEQNMLLFAPNVFVVRYLDATDQLRPAALAQAERFMTTGYQRELTYRHEDGSFSAFGEDDESGSLWLTAFVLKSFAQADGLIYVDETVLRDAARWMLDHQRDDGSFEPVGFVHHTELLGGLRGNTALTAYVAIALHEAGYRRAAGASVSYLERRLDAIDDPYTLAMVAYALQLAGSDRAGAAVSVLLAAGASDGDGLHWGGDGGVGVETTGYGLLALVEAGDGINAGRAARWLAQQRNAFGGYGSTQDTVVGLQALIEYAGGAARFGADLTVNLTAGDWHHQVAIDADNADLVQIVELPAVSAVSVAVAGSGRAVAQVVRRYNRPEVAMASGEVEMFQIDVAYSADSVAVDDTIEVAARLVFAPADGADGNGDGYDTDSGDGVPDAGMVLLDVAVPTGFAPVMETVERLANEHPQVKRYEIAGRKVIIYLEDVVPGEALELGFAARAQYPVRALPVTSRAYSYYRPEWRGETLGAPVTVLDR